MLTPDAKIVRIPAQNGIFLIISIENDVVKKIQIEKNGKIII